MLFKQQFLLFKQHNIYFYTIFSLIRIFTTLKQRYQNNIIKQVPRSLVLYLKHAYIYLHPAQPFFRFFLFWYQISYIQVLLHTHISKGGIKGFRFPRVVAPLWSPQINPPSLAKMVGRKCIIYYVSFNLLRMTSINSYLSYSVN